LRENANRGLGYSVAEDQRRATSRHTETWTPEDKFVWRLEVRELLAGANLRIGEITLKGSWDGTLTLAIEETPGLNF